MWVLAIAAYACSNWNPGAEAHHHPIFLNLLEPAQRELLVLDDDRSLGTEEVDMPNGHRLRFKPGTNNPRMTSVAKTYHEITVRAKT